MRKILLASLIAALVVPATAQAQDQHRGSDGDARTSSREWNRDSGRDDRSGSDDWRRGRDERGNQASNRHRRSQRHWQYYGGEHGYDGYRGSWRSGQKYSNYRNSRYMIRNYRQYDLPPPQRGYRYYRDNNGDVVMAAVATGIIGLIIGGALSNGHR
jgi:Ni/Co efflux regulator RcnB